MAGTPDPARAAGDRRMTVLVDVRTVLAVTAVVALGWAFVSVRGALMTIFVSIFLALVLDPPTRFVMRKLRMGRGGAAAIVVLGLAVVAVGLLAVLLAPLVDAVRNLVDELPSIVQQIRDSSIGAWVDQRSDIGEQLQQHVSDIPGAVAKVASGVLGIGISTFGLILGAVTSLFMTLYLVIDLPRLVDAVESLTSPAGSRRWRHLTSSVTTAVSRTMLGSLTIAVVCGTTYGIASWILGTPAPLAMALLAGLLDLIPMVGATISGVILVAFTLTNSVGAAIGMLVVVLVYQQVENYVLQPTIVGKAADVSGFFVIASVLLFSALIGVVGALIAVPIAASIQIVLRELTDDRRQRMAALKAGAATVDALGEEHRP